MDRVYQSNAVGTPPTVTQSSGAYPTAGNKSVGQLATVPGPYWFYSVTEELRNAIVAMGLTPDAGQVNQLALALSKLLPLTGGTLSGDLRLIANLSIRGDDDVSSHAFMGGSSSESGAYIHVYGKNAEGNPGGFYIVANDGKSSTTLAGSPNGSLYWGDRNVICVESWREGYLWYRKYSDGWIEQGNLLIDGGQNTVTFPVAFKDKNYTFVASGRLDNQNAGTISCAEYSRYRSETSTQVTCRWNGQENTGIQYSWFACGY